MPTITSTSEIIVQYIHVGDAGIDFRTLVRDNPGPIDLSLARRVEVRFQKPDGSMLVVPATLPEGGSDGIASYVTTGDDFDQDGTWLHQVYYEIGPARVYSNIAKFKVFPNLPLEA